MKKQAGYTYITAIIVYALIGFIMVFAVWWFEEHKHETNNYDDNVITNFEECVAATGVVMESYPRQCIADGITYVEVLTNTNINLNKTSQINVNVEVNTNHDQATSDFTIYDDEILGISFEYPSAWGQYDTKKVLEGETDQGSMVRVDFPGSAGNSDFDTAFQLLYTSSDFAPGREIWLGDVLATYYSEYGLDSICNPSEDESYYNLMCYNRDCEFGTWENGNTITFYSQINALDNTDVISFVKIYIFETGHDIYPLGVLAMYLLEANPDNVAVDDAAEVTAIYESLRDGTADMVTNQRLADFDAVVASLTATVIDTTDWLTYENDEYGFGFQYPASASLEFDNGNNADLSIVSLPTIDFYYYDSILTIPDNELNNHNATTIEQLVENSPTMEMLGDRQIGGYQAVAVQEGGYGTYYVLYIQKEDDSVYKIFVNDWDMNGYQLTAEEEAVIESFSIM